MQQARHLSKSGWQEIRDKAVRVAALEEEERIRRILQQAKESGVQLFRDALAEIRHNKAESDARKQRAAAYRAKQSSGASGRSAGAKTFDEALRNLESLVALCGLVELCSEMKRGR